MNNNIIENIDSPYIHTATVDNFNELVLENSDIGPVLVNFYSKKAGPCLKQYPILDQIVHFYDGRVLLINIDVDIEVIVTKEQGIASVPTIKIFRYKKVIETMFGFQSLDNLKEMMEPHVARDSDLILADAINLYTQNKASEAYKMIGDAIEGDPLNPRLPLTVCKLLKNEKRYTDAIKVIDSLPENIGNNSEILQFRDVLSFCEDLDTNQNLTEVITLVAENPDDLNSKRQLVNSYVIEKQYDRALEQLVEIIKLDQQYNNNYAQKAMLKIFNILGDENELVTQYRSNLKHYTH